MKVLFLSAVLPYPLHSGGQIRIFHLLRRLTKKHEITLFSFIRDTGEEKLLGELSFCKKIAVFHRGKAWQARYILPAIFGTYPFLLATYNNNLVRRAISGELATHSYDLVHIEPFYVWPALPKVNIPFVAGEHNIEYEVYQEYVRQFSIVPLRSLLSFDVFKLRFWEEYVWRKAHAVTAVSPEDADLVSRAQKNVTVVPNGVSIAEFPFNEQKSARKAPLLLFVGNFTWLPNRNAATTLIRSIWPAVQKHYPTAELHIVGRGIPPAIRHDAETKGVVILEDVKSISEHYREADILVAPMRIAGGTKFKMLEAFASGLPVITTKQGVEGLGAQASVHYTEATTPDEFVAQIRQIWENNTLRAEIIKNARRLVEERYNWDTIADTLDSVWRQYEKRS